MAAPLSRKRKVAFSGQDEVREFDVRGEKRARSVGTTAAEPADADLVGDVREAHTLESDEEDVEDVPSRRYKLTEDDIHEELDEKFTDGGVALTAFNLKEEMEDGHFDATGVYVEHKDDEAGADAWLEGVEIYVAKDTEDVAAMETEPERKSKLEYLRDLLLLMQPRESVNRALRRHGGTVKGVPVDKTALDLMTDALDNLLAMGLYDIYQSTFEKVAHDIQLMEAGSSLTMFEYKVSYLL